jgi:hypothetical protein
MNAVNDAPVATSDSYTTNEDTPLSVPAPGVLANDTDVDSASLTALLVSGPALAASFTLDANGLFSYTPLANYNGPDSFTYSASDASKDSNVGTVNITVIAVVDPPSVTTSSGSLAYTESDPATVIDTGLTASAPDSPSIVSASVQITTACANGEDVLAFTNTTTITGVYTPGSCLLALTGTDTAANYHAALRSVTYANTSENPSTAGRTVTFSISDGTSSGSGTRGINVTAVNDARPMACQADRPTMKTRTSPSPRPMATPSALPTWTQDPRTWG